MSPEEEKARSVTQATLQIQSAARRNYQQLVEMQKSGIRALWHAAPATPQDICDSLGNQAAKVFAAHGALTSLIVRIAQLDGTTPDILLPTHAFTIHGDGTVTILDSPYTP